jgi:hypothetical protein
MIAIWIREHVVYECYHHVCVLTLRTVKPNLNVLELIDWKGLEEKQSCECYCSVGRTMSLD